MTTLTREDVTRIIEEARTKGITPDLSGANLRGADLSDANLSGADLSDADLSWANLRGANLRWVYLRRANLSGADLSGADLSEADLGDADLGGVYLRGADLRRADLSWANLRGAGLSDANLSEADLSDADLRWADLSGAIGAFGLGGTPSGPADLRPLPNGTWQITVGCFKGTTSELRAVIAGDDWPSECDEEERDRRRPILTALAALADAIAAYYPHLLDANVKKWGTV